MLGMVTLISLVQPPKVPAPILVMLFGMVMLV